MLASISRGLEKSNLENAFSLDNMNRTGYIYSQGDTK
jgi:hypothetical protein